jgi:hypothetical protein
MGLRSPACWEYGFESHRPYGCLFLVSVVLSATGRSLAQSSPTECGLSECDCESSTMRRPRPNKVVELPKHTHTHTHTHINTEFFHGSWVVFSACAKIVVISLISISKSFLTISFLLMISVACDILCCISTARVDILRVLCLK